MTPGKFLYVHVFTMVMATLVLGCQRFPATGQTTVYRAGDDGDFRAGSALSYTDNGDGTITDNNTGLQWEKKSDDGSIHDKDTKYTWANAFAVHVARLNIAPCFAGHCDWRLPNVKELDSIVNYQNFRPAVSQAFNTNCSAGATVLTGSCTTGLVHWSSTTSRQTPEVALVVHFGFGGWGGFLTKIPGQQFVQFVRAVRGGTLPIRLVEPVF